MAISEKSATLRHGCGYSGLDDICSNRDTSTVCMYTATIVQRSRFSLVCMSSSQINITQSHSTILYTHTNFSKINSSCSQQQCYIQCTVCTTEFGVRENLTSLVRNFVFLYIRFILINWYFHICIVVVGEQGIHSYCTTNTYSFRLEIYMPFIN